MTSAAIDGPTDLDLRGRPVERAVGEALRCLRSRRWTGLLRARWDPSDPGSRAVAGLLRVAAAEEGPDLVVVLDPELRLVRAPCGGQTSSPLALPLRLPDAALRTLAPDPTADAVRDAFAQATSAASAAVCTVGDDLLGRPYSAASAALAGALGAWAEGNGRSVLALGPHADRPAARHLGVGTLAGSALAAALSRPPDRGLRLIADLDWPAALAAFPHLAAVAAHLASAPGRGEVLLAVRDEVGRLLGRERPAVDRGFGELGLDSVGAGELRLTLERRFGVVLPPALVFEHPTVAAVADRVLAELRRGRA